MEETASLPYSFPERETRAMSFRPAMKLFLAAAMACLALASPAAANSLADVKARGALIVGVKDRAPPFSSRDTDGHLKGLEIDLAGDLAARLGVKLQLFPVDSAGRMQFLELDMIDLVLATLAITPYRQQQAALIQPYYYASDAALLVKRGSGIGSGADLGGKPVCTFPGVFYLTELESKARPVSFRQRQEAAEALAGGKCAAFAAETANLAEMKRAAPERWADYDIVPATAPALPWAIAVRQDERSADLRKFVADTVTDWHKTGKLVELEKKWLGRNTPWVLEMHNKLK
jgi:polar amino acid transport system substrate-binding protein